MTDLTPNSQNITYAEYFSFEKVTNNLNPFL